MERRRIPWWKRVPWWIPISAAPMGLGSWAPIVPAREVGRRSWAALGALWTALTLIGWLTSPNDSLGDGSYSGMLIILGWAGAVATTLSIRRPYLRELESGFADAEEDAEHRLRERRRAMELAREEPELAEELGVGRPDRPGARDAGLVDVNNAPVGVLARLPGVDDALATRIVEVRTQINGFESLADMGSVLDLDGATVERLRDETVFLPR